MGGFECSTHRLASGRRLDLIKATRHDRFALQDYGRLKVLGIRAARDGIRWHLIEQKPCEFDFSSVTPMIRAAEEVGLTVLWDLCHYGWPDHVDVFRPQFIESIAQLTRKFVRHHIEVAGRAPWIAPVNEISFFAWAGGQIAMFNPCKRRRGDELKAQLVRAAIAAVRAAREVSPDVRIVHTDPLIHVVGAPGSKRAASRAAAYREAQFQSWDMISGRLRPELGGSPDCLDVIGVNFYPNNQWMVFKTAGTKSPPYLAMTDPLYMPLRFLLQEIHERYGRPFFLSETGTEGDGRGPWLRYVADEVHAAHELGIPVGGICLYPVLNHPGWTNNRHCHNGLWDYADRRGNRELFGPLAAELERQAGRFERTEKARAVAA